jgi:hypothetical protein
VAHHLLNSALVSLTLLIDITLNLQYMITTQAAEIVTKTMSN